MGQEIDNSRFTEEDFIAFKERLSHETDILSQWIKEGELASEHEVGGCELEAWLVDNDGHPLPENEAFLAKLSDPLVVPELSRFNIELNTHPHKLEDGYLDTLHAEISKRWRHCEFVADELGMNMLMTGILPTIKQDDLCPANMSSMKRYRALNEQIFRLRKHRPIELDIKGREHLHLQHHDVMLEAATTSFQIHFKVDIKDAVRAFNASKILSAPMAALAANSPFLFAHDLWDETRIPLFEQAVSVGGSDYSKRVTFGIRYAEKSILECFIANRDRYPVLLPTLSDEPVDELPHLRLQNGTIWRWNRPLVGFSDNGRPHIRIEHRVVPSGPTPRDMVANAAFYFGLVKALMDEETAPEQRLPFKQAHENFYKAAAEGLGTRVTWLDGRAGKVDELILDVLLPMASQGLASFGLGKEEIETWLGIIRQRVQSGMTGAAWQRAWTEKYDRDFPALVRQYRELQNSDQPIHAWAL